MLILVDLSTVLIFLHCYFQENLRFYFCKNKWKEKKNGRVRQSSCTVEGRATGIIRIIIISSGRARGVCVCGVACKLLFLEHRDLSTFWNVELEIQKEWCVGPHVAFTLGISVFLFSFFKKTSALMHNHTRAQVFFKGRMGNHSLH